MFYTEERLLKGGGPLAQVWLAATMEKKVSKNDYLGLNITTSVEAISNPDTGPKPLRVSGQLLLGVTTVYQKKAQYLYDDCSEFILRLRTNKPGNVDATTTTTLTGRGEQALTMQNQIAEAADVVPDLPPELEDVVAPPPLMLDDDMPLDLDEAGEDIVMGPYQGEAEEEDASIELGRGRQEEVGGDNDNAANNEPFIGDEEDLGLDLGDMDESIEIGREAQTNPQEDLGDNDIDLFKGDQEGDVMGSPIGPTTPGGANDLEDSVQLANLSDGLDDHQRDEDERQQEAARKRAVAKGPKKKATQFDEQTTLDYTGPTSLSQDNRVQLYSDEEQNRYGFSLLQQAYRSTEAYTNLLYQPPVGMPHAVASLLDPQTIREAIRQRDQEGATISDEEQEGRTAKTQRTENTQPVEGEHELAVGDNDIDLGLDGADGFQMDYEEPEIPAQSRESSPVAGNQLFGPSSSAPQQEPTTTTSSSSNRDISQNTLKAAEILRNEVPTDEDSTTFNHLVSDTNRSDKVKMFFELLVLSTKDAINVNQPTDYGDISITSKDRLYGEMFRV